MQELNKKHMSNKNKFIHTHTTRQHHTRDQKKSKKHDFWVQGPPLLPSRPREKSVFSVFWALEFPAMGPIKIECRRMSGGQKRVKNSPFSGVPKTPKNRVFSCFFDVVKCCSTNETIVVLYITSMMCCC